MKVLKVSSNETTAVSQAIDFFSEIVANAKDKKTVLHAAFSDINDELSSKMIKILQREDKNLTIVIMLKQNIAIDISAQVLHCNAIENQLPFKVLIVAGNESYLISKSNETSGSISCAEATAEARSVLTNIMSVYI